MRRIDLRNAIFCALVTVAAFFIVNPFVELGFDDDFSYAWTVRRLLDTGHITFNGWSAPVLISHALWGALFCKIFGFSFTVLRFSTLPMAAGCAAFTYLLARSAQLRPSISIFASLTLCLCPAFLPLATSFMTDIPALFYMLASLYFLVRTGLAPTLRSSISWLIAGAIFGIIGGMGRQTVWGVPLCIIPYLILRRRDPRFILAAIACWLLVLLDAWLTLRWFARQPWAFIDPPLLVYLDMTFHLPYGSLTAFLVIVFTTVMFAMPALVPFLVTSLVRFWNERKTWRGAVTAIVIVLLSIPVSRHPAFTVPPWLFNIVTAKGVIGSLEIAGYRPYSLPLAVRGILSAMVLTTCYLLAARITEAVCQPRATFNAIRRFFQIPDSRPILAIFGVAYCALLVIRSSHDLIFDRYCLPLMPCLMIPLFRITTACPPKPKDGRRVGYFCAYSILAIYIAYSLASTQDNLALARARRTAINLMLSHGVPRTEIAGGFEYDFYTQLQEQGHINRAGVTNPPHAFNDVLGYTPAMLARYRLESPRYAYMLPSQFGEIDYVSWLPPFHRKVIIAQFPDPWWLDTTHPHKTPPPTNFEIDYED